ncbi:MAG: phosphatidylserine decarboxylase [Terriglobales bacterium]
MVRDGYFYGIGSAIAAGLIIWLTWWPYAIPVLLLGAFCLWFFRDPERQIPSQPGIIVSPGDGKVTDVSTINCAGGQRTRISIFLNVFNVHVNRSPIAGIISEVRYQRGKFLNAMGAMCADENEQNIVTVEGEGRTVVFKQIAGLIARRIIFNLKVGDTVDRGQRVGLIKFGSRVDVIFDSDATVQVKIGDHVKGGATILALLPVEQVVPKKAATSQSGATSPNTAPEAREVSSWKG